MNKSQTQTAKENIKKAQETWQNMSSKARSRRQPEGRSRQKPGEGGEGEYYHISVRDKNQFSSFRYHDVGEEGGIQRLAGHRKSGSWDTQKWIIEKRMAHMEGEELIPDHKDAKDVFEKMLSSTPVHVKGDIFRAKPRENVPEKDKPTEAQKQARQKNIKKAQEAWSLESRTKDELYERAQELEIEGRSKMSKSALIKAIRSKE